MLLMLPFGASVHFIFHVCKVADSLFHLNTQSPSPKHNFGKKKKKTRLKSETPIRIQRLTA